MLQVSQILSRNRSDIFLWGISKFLEKKMLNTKWLLQKTLSCLLQWHLYIKLHKHSKRVKLLSKYVIVQHCELNAVRQWLSLWPVRNVITHFHFSLQVTIQIFFLLSALLPLIITILFPTHTITFPLNYSFSDFQLKGSKNYCTSASYKGF